MPDRLERPKGLADMACRQKIMGMAAAWTKTRVRRIIESHIQEVQRKNTLSCQLRARGC